MFGIMALFMNVEYDWIKDHCTRNFRSAIKCLTPMLGPLTRCNLDQEFSGRDPRSCTRTWVRRPTRDL